MGNPSEIALIKEWIDCEVNALQQVRNGFAQVASHETIMHHYRVLDVCYQGLAEQVGRSSLHG